jgi:hypothetical protein
MRDFRRPSISEFFNDICAKETAGVDVDRSLRITIMDVAVRKSYPFGE